MSDNIIQLDDFRKVESRFCLSVTIFSDGKIRLDKDLKEFETKEQVAWAIELLSSASADMLEFKETVSDG